MPLILSAVIPLEGISAFPRQKKGEQNNMDLFADIPEEIVEKALNNIRENLHLVGIGGGDTEERYTDIQPYQLKMRLTLEDIGFATSFCDLEIAKAAAEGILIQCFEEQILPWLRCKDSDILSVFGMFRKTVGYGYRRGDQKLYENLHRACLRLVKDDDADWGFRVESGYPVFSNQGVTV